MFIKTKLTCAKPGCTLGPISRGQAHVAIFGKSKEFFHIECCPLCPRPADVSTT